MLTIPHRAPRLVGEKEKRQFWRILCEKTTKTKTLHKAVRSDQREAQLRHAELGRLLQVLLKWAPKGCVVAPCWGG